MSDKSSILGGLLRLEFAAGSVDFRSVLSRLAVERLGKDAIEAGKFADLNIRKYWNWLAMEMDAHRRRGIEPFFLPLPSNSYALSDACHPLIASSCADDQLKGSMALARPFLLKEIDKLTDREYEAMACLACQILEATNFELTPPGNEGGIDFFAVLPVTTRSHIFSAPGKEIRIVGQCKKYKSPVQSGSVSEFVQTVQNVRYRSPRVLKHLPSWFQDANGPIIGWEISHSGFQSGASDEAKAHGIIVSDTLDIAELFALSKNFHISESPVERAEKLGPCCRALL